MREEWLAAKNDPPREIRTTHTDKSNFNKISYHVWAICRYQSFTIFLCYADGFCCWNNGFGRVCSCRFGLKQNIGQRYSRSSVVSTHRDGFMTKILTAPQIRRVKKAFSSTTHSDGLRISRLQSSEEVIYRIE